MLDLLTTIDGMVWGNWLVVLLVGTGIVLTIATKFVQARKFPAACKHIVSGESSGDGDITPFQALATSLSATVGTGNIAGVATALVAGGPGAIFWMWITALFGGATKFAEAVLAVKYRETNDEGEQIGGPMYYIEKGIEEQYGWNFKWLGVTFAIFAVIASFGIGNVVQANSISAALDNAYGVPTIVTGIILAILVAVVVIGGIKSIANVTDKVVPGMAFFYIIGAIIVLVINADKVGSAFSLIFSNAFTGQAVIGGGLGIVISKGVARGVFSNEAGLGSAAIAHAASTTDSPYKQGMVASLGTFIDTILICTMTALVILTSGLVDIVGGSWHVADAAGNLIAHNSDSAITGAALTTDAFAGALGEVGKFMVAIGITFFAFSTILGWFFYSSRSLEYLFGTGSIKVLKVVFPLLVLVGSVLSLEAVWAFSSITNGLMAVPNLIGLLLLLPVVYQICRDEE